MRRACLIFALVMAAGVARADDPQPTPEKLRFAADEDEAGYRAYKSGDYDTAASHFENAFFAAPKADELKKAIRARRDAKEYARAATLAALGKRKYPSDASVAQRADEAIAEAKPKVYEVSVACSIECGVVADQKIVTIERAKDVRFFLEPGDHALVVSFSEDRTKELTIHGRAGGSEAVKVEPPPPKPPPPPTASSSTLRPPPTSSAPPPPPPDRKPLAPVFFFAGLGLTAIGTGATIVSGIDAKNNPGADAVKRDCVGQGESCPEYQQGRSAQLRTNILLGVTGGVAAATAIVGLFFTQWGAPAVTPTVGVVPGGMAIGLGGRL